MPDATETLRVTEGGFTSGQSGNPAGRPKGSRNKATLVAEALLKEATGPVVAKAIGDALAGDGPMLRTLVQTMCRKNPGRPIELDVPEGSWGDPVVFLEATMRAVALGEITPQEAALLARLASVMVQAQRLKLWIDALEKKLKPAADVARPNPAAVTGPATQAADPAPARPKTGGQDRRREPVSPLYPHVHAGNISISSAFPQAAGSCIDPVNSRGDERRKAA